MKELERKKAEMTDSILILKSGSCSWKKCIFCGYGRIIGYRATEENVRREFDLFFSQIKTDTDSVKVFGSGSFLDEKQVPQSMRRYFIEKCLSKNVKRLTIESRPEHITGEKLGEFKGLELTVAIGLEAADNQILDEINKGFHLEDYEKAVDAAKKAGVKVRTYLLVNLPGETEKTLENSVEYALRHSDSIVLINLLPHGNTPLFEKWIEGEWNYLTKDEFQKKTERWAKNSRIELDAETFKFTPQFQAELKKPLNGVGEEYLTHPYFEVWQDFILRWYKPVQGKIPLFLPCSNKKPYGESETHKRIIGMLESTSSRKLFHELMLSNPGVIPREFEDKYPFNNYDWDERLETEEIKKRYTEVTEQRIERYLKAHEEYIKKACCYLKPDSESYIALEEACKSLEIPLFNLLSREAYEKIKEEKKVLQTTEALKSLEEGLKCLQQDSTS